MRQHRWPFFIGKFWLVFFWAKDYIAWGGGGPLLKNLILIGHFIQKYLVLIPENWDTVVFAVSPPSEKWSSVKDLGGGIYGVSSENEIYGTQAKSSHANLLLKSLNHGGYLWR